MPEGGGQVSRIAQSTIRAGILYKKELSIGSLLRGPAFTPGCLVADQRPQAQERGLCLGTRKDSGFVWCLCWEPTSPNILGG